jgi:NAD(P)-dependent dehydrogenase (short-subunit alcohol dehydrogenase family)
MAPDTLSLEGKTAIVTGSGRENGIGSAIARALARNGANVTINYVSDGSASRAADVAESLKALGAQAIVVQADVSTPAGASKIVKETLAGFGTDKIDILSNYFPRLVFHSDDALTNPLQSTTPATAVDKASCSST